MYDLLAQVSEAKPGEVTILQSDYVTRLGNFITYEFSHYENIIPFLKSVGNVWLWISLPISLFCIVGIIISVDGLSKIRRAEHRYYYGKKIEEAEEDAAKPDMNLSNRWRHVLERTESTNESDWRQAIIDADSILDEILVKMGYQGEGVGERLQRVTRGDMKSLDEAWDAHKIRNRIAHDGTAFALSQHEAKRVINQYRKVFEEFYYI
jgi:hypothetical protein